MYYCENCNIKSETQRCPRCGKRNLREIQADDFCFFAQMEAVEAQNLKDKLDSEGIGCALIPFGSGLRTRFGMHLEDYLVFIQYGAIPYVEDLFMQEALRKTELFKQELVANIDKLFILDKDAKRVIKQLKLPKDTDLVELCKSVILTATQIVDKGPLNPDEDDLDYYDISTDDLGHYYCVANDTYEVWLNSTLLRVYKVNKV